MSENEKQNVKVKLFSAGDDDDDNNHNDNDNDDNNPDDDDACSLMTSKDEKINSVKMIFLFGETTKKFLENLSIKNLI